MFTFISDRNKGLMDAINDNFTNNHHSYCAFHLQKNVSDKYGAKVSKNICRMAKTFSVRMKDKYLSEIGVISQPALEYVNDISSEHWLSSEWVIDNNLPPRYGITTSNMSESMNNMLQGARDVCWLESIDFIITKMSKRISTLRTKYKNLSGVVDNALSIMQDNWENCTGFVIDQIEEDGVEFLITRTNQLLSQLPTTHTINVQTNTCTCGLWQEYCIPCIDATAYMKLYEQRSLEYVLKHNVSTYYQINTLKLLFKTNIRPVSLDKLKSDKTTKPPIISLKRQAGRPRNKRVRKRNKPLPKIVIICSRCGASGHNVRTCVARKNTKKKPSLSVDNNIEE
jgi:hypothetical protein